MWSPSTVAAMPARCKVAAPPSRSPTTTTMAAGRLLARTSATGPEAAGRLRGRRAPAPRPRSAQRRGRPEKAANGRRFPGAVGPEKTEDAAGRHRQVEPVDGAHGSAPPAPVLLAQPLDFDHRRHG